MDLEVNLNEIDLNNDKRVRQIEILSKYIDRPVKFFLKHNISPNLLSYLGFLSSLGASLFIAFGFVRYTIWLAWLVPFCLFFAGAFDVFDGEVARRTNKDSKAGAFLDSNLDRLSDAAIVLGLIYSGLIDFLIGYILLFVVIMISYIRARSENEGVDMKGVGLMERAERMILLFFGVIVESWTYYLTDLIFDTPFTLFFLIFIYIFTLLLIYTLGQRILHTFKFLRKSQNNIKDIESNQ